MKHVLFTHYCIASISIIKSMLSITLGTPFCLHIVTCTNKLLQIYKSPYSAFTVAARAVKLALSGLTQVDKHYNSVSDSPCRIWYLLQKRIPIADQRTKRLCFSFDSYGQNKTESDAKLQKLLCRKHPKYIYPTEKSLPNHTLPRNTTILLSFS